MPKRIPGLSETILDQAALLFSQHGYSAVDMKHVAAEAGTSVGNLYNYYPSKPTLFLAVKLRWKEELLEVCEGILASELPRREKILTILSRLYDDVSGWHGLWAEFLRGQEELAQLFEAKTNNSGDHTWGLGPEERILLNELEILLTGTTPPDHVARWALLAIMATLQLAARYPADHTENWKFIETLVDKI